MNNTIIEFAQGAIMAPDRGEMLFMAIIAGLYIWTCWKAMTGGK